MYIKSIFIESKYKLRNSLKIKSLYVLLVQYKLFYLAIESLHVSNSSLNQPVNFTFVRNN